MPFSLQASLSFPSSIATAAIATPVKAINARIHGEATIVVAIKISKSKGHLTTITTPHFLRHAAIAIYPTLTAKSSQGPSVSRLVAALAPNSYWRLTRIKLTL